MKARTDVPLPTYRDRVDILVREEPQKIAVTLTPSWRTTWAAYRTHAPMSSTVRRGKQSRTIASKRSASATRSNVLDGDAGAAHDWPLVPNAGVDDDPRRNLGGHEADRSHNA